MTLFTRAFDLKLVTRIWDFYFIEGINMLFKTAIGKCSFASDSTATLTMLEKELIDREFDEILMILQRVSNFICEEDEDDFVKAIHNVAFPSWVIQEIPLLESEFF